MKLRNIDFVIADFNKLHRSWLDDTYSVDKEDIKYYFDADNAYSTRYNTAPQLYANEYQEFAMTTIFPFDGSWIAAKSAEGKEVETAELLDKLNAKITQSNFYRAVGKLIKYGVLYKKGLLESTYKNGVEFKTFDNEEVFTNDNCDEASRRAYAVTTTTLEDVVENYEGNAIVEMMMRLPTNEAEKLQAMYTPVQLVTAILPVNSNFYDKPKRGIKYRREYFIFENSMLHHITQKEDKNAEYLSFPLLNYNPAYDVSLASLALPSAVMLDQYESLINRFARKVLNPTVGLDQNTFINNAFNFGENGLVPLMGHHRTPAPIESSQRFNITKEEVQRHEAKIRQVFKIDLISRVKLTNLSQFEIAANHLAAINAILPAASDLITKVPQIVLSRVHQLLKKHDPEYRKLAAKVGDIDFEMAGIKEKIEKLKKAIGLARAAQGMVPFVQTNQQAAQVVDSDKALAMLFESWDVAGATKPKEKYMAERKAMAQAAQQAQQQQQANMAADTAAKGADAQKKLSESQNLAE